MARRPLRIGIVPLRVDRDGLNLRSSAAVVARQQVRSRRESCGKVDPAVLVGLLGLDDYALDRLDVDDSALDDAFGRLRERFIVLDLAGKDETLDKSLSLCSLGNSRRRQEVKQRKNGQGLRCES